MGKISLILPVYNEGVILQEVLAKYITDLKQIGTPYEVIVVNDGSTDGTDDILLNASKLNRAVRVVNLDGRYGKQAAITAGMDAADKNSVAIMLADVDILNPIGILGKVVDEYKQGNPMVYAKRECYGAGKVRERINHRAVKLGAKFFGVDGSYTGKVNIALYSRSVADVIIALPNRNKFLRAMDNWLGWQIKYIDYASGYNKAEEKAKIKESVVRQKIKGPQARDRVREHTTSVDLCYGFIAATLIMVILGLYFALGTDFAWGWQLMVWLVGVCCAGLAFTLYTRAILIKRVGLVHTVNTDRIYYIKNVIN